MFIFIMLYYSFDPQPLYFPKAKLKYLFYMSPSKKQEMKLFDIKNI